MENFLFEWNQEKNRWLQENRGISFEEIKSSILNGNLLKTIQNPSKNYPNQLSFVVKVNIHDYIYLVPFIKTKQGFFLKTAYKSRKHQKIFNREQK